MKLFTIGYSGYGREAFVRALQEQGVNLVIDVRSIPASGYRPEYDRAAIEKYLCANGIQYRHMPDEFGARQEDKRYIGANGAVDFELFSQSEVFRRGLEQIFSISALGKNCALMCAEKDAIVCHRAILVARAFHEWGWRVRHISPDGLQTHQEIERRLLELWFPNRFQMSMFEPICEERKLIEKAYRLQNERIGFRTEARV